MGDPQGEYDTDPMPAAHDIVMKQVAAHQQRVHDALEKMIEEWLTIPGLPGIMVTHYKPKPTPTAHELNLGAVTIEWSALVPPQHVYHYYSDEQR